MALPRLQIEKIQLINVLIVNLLLTSKHTKKRGILFYTVSLVQCLQMTPASTFIDPGC